ncbi:MAG: phosphoesterase, partial [Deltaproteobacteria bacterium]|nr:phosphoesterase [Deltaproteobacteria bacterium]
MKFPHLAISAFVLLVSAVGCGGGGGGDARTENVVVRWNTKAIEAIRAVKLGPPFTARTLAVVHTCMFDAWAAYDSKSVGTQLGDSLRRPAAEHTIQNKEEAVSFAAHRALVDVYPSQKSNFDGLMTELGYDPANVTTDVTTPAGVANVACGKVLEFRHADGSNQLGDLGGTGPYTDYTGHVAVNTPDVVTAPSKWQPLRFANGA